MKYIPLSSLQNPYSSISKYRKEQNSVSIDGFYEENSLNIPTLDFTNLGVISNTSFRFIVRVFDNESNNNVLTTFTSEFYYNDLERAKKSSNPYFINTALNPDLFIKIYLNDIQKTFNRRVSEELKDGVSVIFNNLFNGNGSVDYQRFGEYIDWVVSQPKLSDIDTNGVLPSSFISSFSVSAPPPDIDFDDEDTSVVETKPSNNNTNTNRQPKDTTIRIDYGDKPNPYENKNPVESNITIEPEDEETDVVISIDTLVSDIVNDVVVPQPIEETDVVINVDTLVSDIVNDVVIPQPIEDREERVNIQTKVIVNEQEIEITPLPTDIAGGSPVSGEGDRGNLPAGGNQGNRNTNRTPQEDISNEYQVRYRKTDREL